MLKGVELKIYHRVTAPDQDNAFFIIQFPHFIGRHKLTPKDIIIPAGTATLSQGLTAASFIYCAFP